MGRARRARRIAAAAAFGGGGLGAIGAAGLGVLAVEARLARRWIGQPDADGPPADGWYGREFSHQESARKGSVMPERSPLHLAVLGDSSASGLGAGTAAETPGAIVAAGLAAASGRPVRLRNVAVSGADSRDLGAQLDRLLGRRADDQLPALDVALIMVGANDVTHRVKPAHAVRALELIVRRLREVGCQVVVGTCPDLGTIEPVAQPLRTLARRWSRQLAAAQTIAVVEAGGRTVSLGDMLGPEFQARPGEMFSADRFHPSPAGYARAAAALLPSVCAAAGYWPDGGVERAPEALRGEGLAPIAQAAADAADDAGTEVSSAQVAGADRGPRGRWAVLLRRRQTDSPVVSAPELVEDEQVPGTSRTTDGEPMTRVD